MLYPENIGDYLSIDEVSLSNGELYTFVTNKKGKGKKGTLVASVKGTRSQDIIDTLERLPLEIRKKVIEVAESHLKCPMFDYGFCCIKEYFIWSFKAKFFSGPVV